MLKSYATWNQTCKNWSKINSGHKINSLWWNQMHTKKIISTVHLFTWTYTKSVSYSPIRNVVFILIAYWLPVQTFIMPITKVKFQFLCENNTKKLKKKNLDKLCLNFVHVIMVWYLKMEREGETRWKHCKRDTVHIWHYSQEAGPVHLVCRHSSSESHRWSLRSTCCSQKWTNRACTAPGCRASLSSWNSLLL